MVILVVGSNGYVGSNFIKEILKNNDNILIRLIDTSEPENNIISNKRVSFLKGDINHIKDLEKYMEDVEIVFHFFGKSLVRRELHLLYEDYYNDVCGTLKILSSMANKKIKKIVFISSGGTVYGNVADLPIKESVPLNPISSYGLIKASIENILHFYNQELIIDPIIIRVSSLYGPNYNKIGIQGVIPTFINNIKKKKEINIYGTGEEIRDFLYIDDLLRLLVSIIYKNFSGETFNIGSGVGVSINQIINILTELSGEKIKINYMPKFQNDVNNIILDISKAKKMLHWTPVIDLNEGLKICWNAY